MRNFAISRRVHTHTSRNFRSICTSGGSGEVDSDDSEASETRGGPAFLCHCALWRVGGGAKFAAAAHASPRVRLYGFAEMMIKGVITDSVGLRERRLRGNALFRRVRVVGCGEREIRSSLYGNDS